MISIGVLVGFLLIFSASICGGITDPPDVAAINKLYVSLGYPPLHGWLLVGGDPCGDKWEGVDCVFANITSIKLSNMNLGGALGDVLDFASIIEIDMSNNHIGGIIPPILPPTIRNLSLYGNRLSGSIPDAFQQLTSLVYLDFSGNKLSGQLPPSMQELSSLDMLHLQENQLTGTLFVLEDLRLNDLNIENNLFSGPIPPQLLNIPNFRGSGNPFNTTIIVLPPAAAPLSPAEAPSCEEAPRKEAGGPSLPKAQNSSKGSSFFTAERLLLTIVGASVVILIAAALCCLSIHCRGGQTEEMGKMHNSGAYSASSNNPRAEMEKVPREAVVKPLDGYVLDHRKQSDRTKHDGRLIDVKKVDEGSKHMKDHTIDMPEIDLNSTAMQLPPPLPQRPVEKKVKPIAPAEITMADLPAKFQSSISAKVFTVASLQQYTDSFSQDNLIGSGIIGSVYRAELPDGKLLAVKKLNRGTSGQQSEEEFIALVSSISKLEHGNIVELVGYCLEHGLQLFVYEYCRNGTLYDALQSDDGVHKKLSWNARMRIVLGAARALEYLHEVCQPPIVHRNFNSANILLDDELVARISDCGLDPLVSSCSANQLSGHHLTGHGYTAPEFESGSYTYRTDVYSFGVVMLEILTGRKSYDRSRPRGEQYLARWVVPQLHDIDALSRMVDTSLNGAYPAKDLSRVADIISRCLQREPEFRPPMSEIVQDLVNMIKR